MRSDEEFDSIIGLLYEAALEPSLWGFFVERLADGLGAAQGTMVMFDVNQPQNAVARVVRFDPAAEDQYLRRRHQEDVWWQRLPGAITGECFTGSDLIDTTEFLATPLAQDVGKTTDIAFMLGGWFQKTGNQLGVVSVLRGRSADDFSTDDRASLRRVLPHLRRAMSMHRRFGEVVMRAREFESALGALSDAIFIVFQDGHVTFCNSAAQNLLRARCGLRVCEGKLALEDLGAHRRMERTLYDHDRAVSATNGYILARCKNVTGPLIVRVFPIPDTRAELFGVSGQRLSAVVISEAGRARSSPPLGLLMGFYGMTRAEASVAASVLSGKRLREIAALEGRSIHTVRAQLKACFARLGVRSQAELVQRLAALCR